jgi:acyl dehydratase
MTISVGEKGPDRVFGPLTRSDIVRYAGASGDFNPIHHDPEVARRSGYPDVFSIGMLQAGLLATYATDWLGAGSIRRFAVRFREQVWPGEVLSCAGEVTAVTPGTTGDMITVELTCRTSEGNVAVAGEADFAAEPDQDGGS